MPDNDIAAAVMFDAARSGHCGSDVDDNGNGIDTSGVANSLSVIHAVLKTHEQRVPLKVRRNGGSRRFRVESFHAEQDYRRIANCVDTGVGVDLDEALKIGSVEK